MSLEYSLEEPTDVGGVARAGGLKVNAGEVPAEDDELSTKIMDAVEEAGGTEP